MQQINIIQIKVGILFQQCCVQTDLYCSKFFGAKISNVGSRNYINGLFSCRRTGHNSLVCTAARYHCWHCGVKGCLCWCSSILRWGSSSRGRLLSACWKETLLFWINSHFACYAINWFWTVDMPQETALETLNLQVKCNLVIWF